MIEKKYNIKKTKSTKIRKTKIKITYTYVTKNIFKLIFIIKRLSRSLARQYHLSQLVIIPLISCLVSLG